MVSLPNHLLTQEYFYKFLNTKCAQIKRQVFWLNYAQICFEYFLYPHDLSK